MSETMWKPIESAPSDGENVLIYGGRHVEPTIAPADGNWWRATGGLAAPTHWMPLPAPPKAATTHSPQLRAGLESAARSLASRPEGLQGPFKTKRKPQPGTLAYMAHRAKGGDK